jgi:hypothetical protein
VAPWRQKLKGDPIPWLLGESHPAVRWYTLRYLLDLPESEPSVLWTQARLPEDPLVTPILAAQHPAGYWNRSGIGLFPFYRGTVWAANLLAEMGLPGDHQAAQLASPHLLEMGFDARGDAVPFRLRGWSVSVPFPRLCLSPLILLPLLRFGFGSVERVQMALTRLAERTLASGCRCPGNRNRPCGWAAAKTLRVFAELPDRSGAIARATDQLVELLLGKPYWDASHFAARDPGWALFAFPLFHQADLLELALTMAALGLAKDPRLAEIVTLVEGKQGADGRWSSDRTLASSGWAHLEEPSQPSKWVTLRALRVIKAVQG